MNQQLEAAEEMLKKMANENPIDARIQMALGATAQRVHIDFAKIYLRLGMKDECIDVLETLRDKPLGMEVGVLKTDKVREPVRSHPAYRAIID